MPHHHADSSAMHKHGTGLADKIGMWLSIACAIHCLATPVLLLAAPNIAAAVPGLEWLEWATVGLAFVLTIAQLYPEYLQHRRPLALGLAIGGLAVLALGLGLDLLALEGWHRLTMVVGSLVMASAFYMGHRLRYHA